MTLAQSPAPPRKPNGRLDFKANKRKPKFPVGFSWVALQGTAHSFIELDKAVVHVIRLVSFLWAQRKRASPRGEAAFSLLKFQVLWHLPPRSPPLLLLLRLMARSVLILNLSLHA